MNYQGSCHCGDVQFSFSGPEITSGLRCNCSICVRKGATMTEFVIAEDELKMNFANDSLAKYEFGSCVAKHYFCKRCGIYPFHQTMRKAGYYRMNVGCIDGIDASNLPFKVFDGASM